MSKKVTQKTSYIIYTDGSCIENGARGGYSAVICKDGCCIAKLYEGKLNTTNNRMELLAVIEGLNWFKTPTEITVVSDSQYVVNSINGKYAQKWIRDNDITKKNLDLWVKLLNLCEFHTVNFKWVKGHNNHSMNEFADKLSRHAATCLNLKNDIET